MNKDDIRRSLNIINHHFNIVGRHMTVLVDGEDVGVMITDYSTDDIIQQFQGDMNTIAWFLKGVQEAIKTMTYEGY